MKGSGFRVIRVPGFVEEETVKLARGVGGHFRVGQLLMLINPNRLRLQFS